MTDQEFQEQIERLENTFGDRHFELERLDLIKQSVMWMTKDQFRHICSNFIATSRHAPLPKDFKDASIAERNRLPNQEKRDQPKIFEQSYSSDSLKRCLVRDYPGCTSLREAIEVERLNLRVKKAFEGD